jgi:hypothetical protein
MTLPGFTAEISLEASRAMPLPTRRSSGAGRPRPVSSAPRFFRARCRKDGPGSAGTSGATASGAHEIQIAGSGVRQQPEGRLYEDRSAGAPAPRE